MGIGHAEGENRAVRAAEEAIICPLLEHSSVDGALGVVVNVKGGTDITMKEVLDAVTTVQKAADSRANIIFGAVIDDEAREEVQVTVIAAGFKEVRPSNDNPLDEQFARMLEQQPESGVEEDVPELEEETVDVTAEVPVAGQSTFHVEDDEYYAEPEPLHGTAGDSDEDLSIPAFMRRRRREEE